jgi:SAM-dependent methyltransferase
MSKRIKKLTRNNIIEDFGKEWKRFHFMNFRKPESLKFQFDKYTNLIELENFRDSEAADFGAGSGRWAELLLPYVTHLHVIEPGVAACEVLKLKFSGNSKVTIHNSLIEDGPVKAGSLDLAISLGVLHHIPKMEIALQSIFCALKPGGTFLGYLYYNLENRSIPYRLIWKISEILRLSISRLPSGSKFLVCEIIALTVYFPLAKFSKLIRLIGLPIENIPLHHYTDLPLYMMRNDALDRFGTTFEKRFSKAQIFQVLTNVGFDLSSIEFSEFEPYWTFKAQKPD